jgi:DNA repair protein RadD
VLYVQGMGRGTRIAPGKEDCLVLDFTDTVERLGPVDIIKGKSKTKRAGDQSAPFCICPECGERNAPAALVCVACGGTIKEPEVAKPIDAKLSYAALLSAQMQAVNTWHDVTRVDYKLHRKTGKPDSMRVDYYDGLLRCASEWVCFDHGGFAAGKARQWWSQRDPTTMPSTTEEAIDWASLLREPVKIATRKNGKFTEVKEYEFDRIERHQDASEKAA